MSKRKLEIDPVTGEVNGIHQDEEVEFEGRFQGGLKQEVISVSETDLTTGITKNFTLVDADELGIDEGKWEELKKDFKKFKVNKVGGKFRKLVKIKTL